MHPEPRRRSRHSRGERDVLAGGAGQNMISFSFPACGRGNSARRALPGESVGRKGIGYPAGDFSRPTPSPRGEGAPVRTLGRMRGRPTHPTEQEKESVEATGPSFYKERLGTKSPPHPTRLRRPTFPPRGRLWGWVRPFPTTTPTSPSPPSWGAGRYGRWFMGRRPGKKEGVPPQSPPTRKGGSREEEPLPPWCSFLRLSSKESRAPARGRAGNGALRPKVASELPTRRVRSTLPRPPHRGR